MEGHFSSSLVEFQHARRDLSWASVFISSVWGAFSVCSGWQCEVSKGVSYLCGLNKHLPNIWSLSRASWLTVWEGAAGIHDMEPGKLCVRVFFCLSSKAEPAVPLFNSCITFLKHSNAKSLLKGSLSSLYTPLETSRPPRISCCYEQMSAADVSVGSIIS